MKKRFLNHFNNRFWFVQPKLTEQLLQNNFKIKISFGLETDFFQIEKVDHLNLKLI